MQLIGSENNDLVSTQKTDLFNNCNAAYSGIRPAVCKHWSVHWLPASPRPLYVEANMKTATLPAGACSWWRNNKMVVLRTIHFIFGGSITTFIRCTSSAFNKVGPTQQSHFSGMVDGSGKSGPKDQVALHYYYTSPSHWCTTHEVSKL